MIDTDKKMLSTQFHLMKANRGNCDLHNEGIIKCRNALLFSYIHNM